MTTWYTADQHFGHRRILKLCDRPFEDVEEMDRTIIARWNERVDPDDTVFVLGDYALGHLDTTLAYTPRLKGHKILIAGNHDRCFTGFARPGTNRTHEQWAQRYLDAGFETVHYQRDVYLEHVDEHVGWVALNHFPYTGDSHVVDRFAEYRPPYEEDGPQLLLHGHVHTSWAMREEPHPMVNVGVDMWDFAPVSGAEIARALVGWRRSGADWKTLIDELGD